MFASQQAGRVEATPAKLEAISSPLTVRSVELLAFIRAHVHRGVWIEGKLLVIYEEPHEQPALDHWNGADIRPASPQTQRRMNPGVMCTTVELDSTRRHEASQGNTGRVAAGV